MLDKRRTYVLPVVVIGLMAISLTRLGLGATEYVVATDGNDDHDGLTREAAFASIQRGVDALAPGDTLTILPGVYAGSVSREGLGSPDADTVIRADIPGTVLLRGDVPAPAFQPVPGFRFVHAAAFPQPVQAVNERDTLRILESEPNPRELEFKPGGFYYDAENQMLYLSTTDLQPPSTHHYSVSVVNGSGLFLVNPDRVIIEGLAATGFHNAKGLPRRRAGHMSGDFINHGFYLWRARRSTLRDCRAFLNAGGITILTSREGGGNRIEGCETWANQSKFGGSVGNIAILDWSEDAVYDSIAYRGGRHGIRLYGRGGAGRLRHNLSWGNRGADFQIKGGEGSQLSHVEHCLAPAGGIIAPNVVHSLVAARNDARDDNIVLALEADLDLDREFADPINHDFRLQSTSRFRGAGTAGADRGPFPYKADVFYVSPDGDDQADGLAVASAWRSLQRALAALAPGDTLYLSAGRYASPVTVSRQGESDLPVVIRGRGAATVIIDGALTVQNSTAMAFERIQFADAVAVENSADIRFSNCGFGSLEAVALRATATRNLRVTHSLFSGFSEAALALNRLEDAFVRGNIFDNAAGVALRLDRNEAVAFSDDNSFRDPRSVWQLKGATQDWETIQTRGFERESSVGVPKVERSGQALRLVNRNDVAARGPFARAVGPWHATDGAESPLRLAGPFVHSVTDTTVNLEWWTSGPTSIRLAWAPAEPDREEQRETHRYGSFSLTGLTPDTEYRVTLTLDKPFARMTPEQVESVTPETVAFTFRTAVAPAERMLYHVSTDGDDANDGLSRQRAFRSVSRAADVARPGDTVWVAGGTYTEVVRPRATGAPDRPIVFRAAPGEKVVFDGVGRTLDCAFYVTDKHHLRFDGFYLENFMHGSPNMPWSDRSGGLNGAFVLYHANDIHITRCFSDSRGPGYGPSLLHARHSANLLLRNNAIIGSMGGGIGFAGCPGLRVEHNVFLRNLIAHIGEGLNEPDQLFTLAYNIFSDSIPSKVTGSLLSIGKIESLIEHANAYYLRVPDAERRLFMFYEPEPAYGRAARAYGLRDTFETPSVIQERTHIGVAEYQQQFNPASDSVVLDPLFKGTLAWDRTDDDGKPVYLGDRLSARDDLDFHHLFTAHPDLKMRGIGLQPEAFADFHFNVAEGMQRDE